MELQKGKNNPVSIDRWNYKQNVVYTNTGIFSAIKGIKFWDKVDELWRHYAKRNNPDTKDTHKILIKWGI